MKGPERHMCGFKVPVQKDGKRRSHVTYSSAQACMLISWAEEIRTVYGTVLVYDGSYIGAI